MESMNEDIKNAQYSPIINYHYEQWFQEVHPNEEEFSDAERTEYLRLVDDKISSFSVALPLMKDTFERMRDLHDEYHEAYRIVVSVMQFTLMTMIDSMVLSKYFILTDKDYDRRLMRGKLKVILNEGFKRLYGFGEKTREKSEWHKLTYVLKYFPEDIKRQYQNLSSLLEKHSTSSSWWKDERDVETHLDANKLYVSRCEDIAEGRVMLDFLKLQETLLAVNLFLSNMHSCLHNFMIYKYRCGELKEE